MSTAASRSGVVVFGSLNMDLVARVPRMPAPGETLAGHSFLANPGGKGANQAVACARQGARVAMVGRVGDDAFGAQVRAALGAEGVDSQGVAIVPGQASGIAMILVDDRGQNCIAVVAGANALVDESEARLLADVPAVTPDTAAAVAELLRRRGPHTVLVTLGEHGVACAGEDGVQVVDAVRVQPVDTTAAGDTFIGVLAALLAEGRAMAEALRHAMRAAAICVTRAGAQAAMPSRAEVERFARCE